MQRLYRTMRRDPDGRPQFGRSARTLGVRVQGEYADVRPGAGGFVLPGEGGMSVTIDDPAQIPPARRPTWIRSGGGRGLSEDPLFVIAPVRVAGTRPDPAKLVILEVRSNAAVAAIRAAEVAGEFADSERTLAAVEAALADVGKGYRPLRVRGDDGAHAFVEPAVPRSLDAYERDLAATRPDWREVPPPRNR